MQTQINDFVPKHTFDCGQCFRWEENPDGSFTGIAGGRVVQIAAKKSTVTIDGINEKDYNDFWKKYLDAERDYSVIKKAVSINPAMETAVSCGTGIRILRQDFTETLLSFIISQRSSIPKIKSCIAKLCNTFGKKLEFQGREYYDFPTVDTLEKITEEDFRALGVGYRASYLVDAVKRIASGDLYADALDKANTATAREKLLEVRGVGDKVCDCVLLFSLGKFDLFPSDVWIKRVMNEQFSASNAKLCGENMFGQYSGFAQQYLFYWRKFNKDVKI